MAKSCLIRNQTWLQITRPVWLNQRFTFGFCTYIPRYQYFVVEKHGKMSFRFNNFIREWKWWIVRVLFHSFCLVVWWEIWGIAISRGLSHFQEAYRLSYLLTQFLLSSQNRFFFSRLEVVVHKWKAFISIFVGLFSSSRFGRCCVQISVLMQLLRSFTNRCM